MIANDKTVYILCSGLVFFAQHLTWGLLYKLCLHFEARMPPFTEGIF